MTKRPFDPFASKATTMERDGERSLRVPIVEETVRLGKAERVTGRVRIGTVTESVEEVVGQDLASETVEITRIPVDREVAEAPAIRQDSDVTIISVVEEIIVVTKRLVVKEEVHIRRIKSTEHVETSINLRKQRAVVERSDAEGDSSVDAFMGERR